MGARMHFDARARDDSSRGLGVTDPNDIVRRADVMSSSRDASSRTLAAAVSKMQSPDKGTREKTRENRANEATDERMMM